MESSEGRGGEPPMAEGSRRFPPPWRADKIPGGYVVRDANEQAIAYVYSPGDRNGGAPAVLTKDEARRIAPTSDA
jgi:hypothetical protein